MHGCIRRTFVALAGSALLSIPLLASASPEVPQPSPRAKVEQRVGITDFSIEYSSPGVKGRKIWGELVPFDEVWRAGANASTLLTASRDFFVGDTPVPAGTYAVYAIPTKGDWTVILNSNTQAWGTRGYDTANDVARITVKPTKLAEPRERLTFIFSDAADGGVHLDLEWEKLRVRIPLRVDTQGQVLAAIDKSVQDAWLPHSISAKYLLDNELDLPRALELIEASIAIKPTWRNHWIQAQIFGKLGDKKKAVNAAQRAQSLGKGEFFFDSFYAEDVARAIAGWK